MRKAILGGLCVIGVSIIVTGCGGGGATGAASRQAYCQQLEDDWDTLHQAAGEVSYAADGLTLPFADKDEISRQLIADKDLFAKAADMAADLAKHAPTRLKSIVGDPPNAQEMFQDMSAAFTKAARGSTEQADLGPAGPDLDAGDTGCNFDPINGPDGSVATEFWS